MDAITYSHFVKLLMKPGHKIVEQYDNRKAELDHMLTLVQTEAGELGTPIKAHVFYNKPLDQANVKEELGDLMFGVQALCNILGWSLDEVIAGNMAKLSERYKSMSYSDEQAIARADKQEGSTWMAMSLHPTHWDTVPKGAEMTLNPPDHNLFFFQGFLTGPEQNQEKSLFSMKDESGVIHIGCTYTGYIVRTSVN